MQCSGLQPGLQTAEPSHALGCNSALLKNHAFRKFLWEELKNLIMHSTLQWTASAFSTDKVTMLLNGLTPASI